MDGRHPQRHLSAVPVRIVACAPGAPRGATRSCAIGHRATRRPCAPGAVGRASRKEPRMRLSVVRGALPRVLILLIGLLLAQCGTVAPETILSSDGADAVARIPHQDAVATLSDDGVRIWRLADHQLLRTLPTIGYGWTLAVTPDARLIATQNADAITVWQLADGRAVWHVPVTWSPYAYYSPNVAFSPDGTLLAGTPLSTTVALWRASDGTPLRRIELGQEHEVTGIAFSPDGTLLAIAADGVGVTFWRVADGTPVRNVHILAAGSVAFSPDGRSMAVDNALYALPGGQRLQSVQVGDQINTVAFSPDGQLVATGTGVMISGTGPKESLVRVMRVRDGQLVGQFAGHEMPVTGVTFRADSRSVIAVSIDSVRVWPLPAP